ncbi:MAG TPA: nicotinate (nicotinamide) nucleotide adenylyltransferase [Chitinophagales bacterium]|nr:nicotinate (nicotinamide) nucleotide adenylyltransferase [Chitinophagales bacterium]
MKIGLFFGSFNPVHNGHLIIANYLCETTDLDKVWLVVSPQSPFKQKETMLGEYDRLNLINLAIEKNTNLYASNIEFKLPKPSYTIDTLTYLKEKYPQHQFCLIMGSDNLETIHKWKNYELILNNYPLYVYNRRGSAVNPYPNNKNITLLDFPFLDISSTFIRSSLKKGISMEYFLPDPVWKYIDEMNLYK